LRLDQSVISLNDNLAPADQLLLANSTVITTVSEIPTISSKTAGNIDNSGEILYTYNDYNQLNNSSDFSDGTTIQNFTLTALQTEMILDKPGKYVIYSKNNQYNNLAPVVSSELIIYVFSNYDNSHVALGELTSHISYGFTTPTELAMIGSLITTNPQTTDLNFNQIDDINFNDLNNNGIEFENNNDVFDIAINDANQNFIGLTSYSGY